MTAYKKGPNQRRAFVADLSHIPGVQGVEACRSSDLRSDDVAGWTERSASVLAYIAQAPRTMSRIKAWARERRLPVTVAEESVYWLEAQGKIARADGAWRVVAR